MVITKPLSEKNQAHFQHQAHDIDSSNLSRFAEIARAKKVCAGKHFMPDFQMFVKTNFDIILKLILWQRGLRE